MKFDLSKPILYLITRGASTETTTPRSPEFAQLLEQISSAVAAGIDLIQLREKRLPEQVLFELTKQAAGLTRRSRTRLLVNDRADVSAAAGADGVHLTTKSLDAATIRRTFGMKFLVGASTHSLAEAQAAKEGGADFAVFGPVFATGSKEKYGPPVGLDALAHVTKELSSFPLLALGGIGLSTAHDCLRAGAKGIAGIGLFQDANRIKNVVERLRR